jgi:hypothetical protein
MRWIYQHQDLPLWLLKNKEPDVLELKIKSL